MTLTGLLVQYSYLQVLDFLSTLAFLLVGVQEANPVVRFALEHASSPIIGLAMVKGAALVLGGYCLWARKQALLKRINIMFAVVVAWNLVALIIGVAHMPKPM